MWTVQSNFSKGELDPQLAGRYDLEQYYQGLKLARNYILIPQGGIKSRPGMEYISTAENGRLEPFTASDGTEYVLLFSNGKMSIYKNDVLQTNINGSGLSYVAISHTLAQILEADIIQSGDTLLIFHGDVIPHKFVTTGDTTWTLSTSFLTNIPQYAFGDSLSPVGTAEVQQITFANTSNSDRFKLMLEGILTDEFVFAGGLTTATRNATANNMREVLQDHPLLKGKSVSVAYDSGSNKWNITLDSGLPYPIEVISATPIQTQNVAADGTCTVTTPGVSSAEPVWSATRGYPRCGTFHQGRLYLAGTQYLPSTVWGSNVNDYFNFRTGRVLDDNALSFTLDTDQVHRIQNIFSNKTLQIFTNQGEFFVDATPITPTNAACKPQTTLGSKRVRPINVEGATFFIQKTGKALNAFEYSDTVASNKTVSISLLAPHLIKSPVQLAVRYGSSTLDAVYCYLVNEDGTVTVLNSLASQNVQSFTRWETDGLIKSVCVLGDDLYFLVNRTINGSSVFMLEKENEALAYDCAKRTSGIGGSTMTGLGHLEGETVGVRALTASEVADSYEGGSILDDEVVSGAQITVGATYDTIEAGLEYTVEGETMPLNVIEAQSTYRKGRIVRAAFDLYESAGFQVDGNPVSTLVLGQSQFDAPQPFTGVKRVRPSKGYQIGSTLTFGRETAHRHQVLSLGLEVKI